jgi:hypothetical protein
MKNEAILLEEVLKFWKDYPLDKFLFWDDNSTDNSIEVVKSILGDRAEIHKADSAFNESLGRNFLAEKSKKDNYDLIFSLDCDELFSYSLVKNFNVFCKYALDYSIGLRQCNVVKGTLSKMRMDPKYMSNFRFFAIPTARMHPLPVSNNGLHQSERDVQVNAQRCVTEEFAYIHLQAINERFYAMKQVYYKIDQIRSKIGNYRKIIFDIEDTANNLNFCEVDTPPQYIADWKFDPKIFDKVLESRGYESIIRSYIDETGDREFCKLALKFL